jgi:dTDP-4-dehydrorhamnose 3,5-epimerase
LPGIKNILKRIYFIELAKMLFSETHLAGAYIIDIEPRKDDRGFFARSWCMDEFKKHNLNPNLVQCNISFSRLCGTLRGMHYQVPPYQETKLVRCNKGAVYDVIIDLRPNSESFKKWLTVELSAENYRALFVPQGFAHGYQTLTDDTEVFYQVSEFYHPEAERGIRWDDPGFGIKWPIAVSAISDKDKAYPLWGSV